MARFFQGSAFGRRVLSLFVLGALTGGVSATETKILLKSDGYPDGYYYTLDNPVGSNSRYITEYRAGDTDPFSVITRARVALANTGVGDGAPFRADLRIEDANNPGYPLLSPNGLIAEADPNHPVVCQSGGRWTDFFVFGGGAGISAPLGKFYLTVLAPEGQAGINACGLQMDTSTPPLGASRFYLSNFGFFGKVNWNHLAEVEVMENNPFDLEARWHGSSRFAGDGGRPIMFARRPSIDGPTDDFISVSLNIDNQLPVTKQRMLHLYVDRGRLTRGSKSGWREITQRFVSIGSNEPIPELLMLPTGRTTLLLEIPHVIPDRFVDRTPVNLEFRVELSDPNFPDPIDFEEAVLGIRPSAGEPDDGQGEGLFLVQTPSLTNDALAVRFPAIDLPTTKSYSISAIQVVGAELGGEDLDGFDTVELRLEDPVLVDAPDLSPAGLVRQIGSMNGVGEIRMGPVMTELTLDVPDVFIDPINQPLGNLWAQVLLNPGDTISPEFGTFLGGDGSGQTLLTDSFYTASGQATYRRDITQNYQIRLLLDGRKEPSGNGNDRSSSIDFRFPPGGFITTGDGIQINLQQYLDNGGGEPGE